MISAGSARFVAVTNTRLGVLKTRGAKLLPVSPTRSTTQSVSVVFFNPNYTGPSSTFFFFVRLLAVSDQVVSANTYKSCAKFRVRVFRFLFPLASAALHVVLL